MEALHHLAARLEEAAAPLAAARPDELDPGPMATWGDDNGGAFGEVVEALGASLTAALHARGREMSAAAAELTRLADSLRLAGGGYRDVDHEVGRSIAVAGGTHPDGGAPPPGTPHGRAVPPPHRRPSGPAPGWEH
jgi:hypothetical protein